MGEDLSNYLTKSTQLGAGIFGNTYKGSLNRIPPELTDYTAPLDVTIHVLQIPGTLQARDLKDQRWEVLKDLVLVWRNVKHPNVVPILGMTALDDNEDPVRPDSDEARHLAVVSLFPANGKVMTYLAEHDDADKEAIVRGVAHGLAHLHSAQIIHGNLTPDTVVIDQQGIPLLTEFGIATMMEDGTLWPTSAVRTTQPTRYMSPEILRTSDVHYTMPADVYSYSMTAYEIVSGTKPLAQYNDGIALIAAVVIDGQKPARPASTAFSNELWNSLQQSWSDLPRDRPSASQAAGQNNPDPNVPPGPNNNNSSVYVIASGSMDGVLQFWNSENCDLLNSVSLPPSTSIYRESLSFSTDGKQLLVAGYGQRWLGIIDVETTRTIWSTNDALNFASFSPDGRLFVCGSIQPIAQIFDTQSRRCLHSLRHDDMVSCAKFSPGSDIVASGDYIGIIKIWNSATGGELRSLTGHQGDVWSLSFSSTGQLASCGMGGKIRVWNVHTGQQIHLMDANEWIFSLSFTPGGDQIVSAGGRIQVWTIETGVTTCTHSMPSVVREAVAFSPDGLRYTSGAEDKGLRIWEAASCRLLYESKEGRKDSIFSVAYSPIKIPIRTDPQTGRSRIFFN